VPASGLQVLAPGSGALVVDSGLAPVPGQALVTGPVPESGPELVLESALAPPVVLAPLHRPQSE
jgi:hypothetical protein